MAFAHREGDPVGGVNVLPNPHDEEAATAIETDLVELGEHLKEVRSRLAHLSGSLSDGTPAELIGRMRQRAEEDQFDLSRLAGAARRELRGE